jgi:oligopeptide/dipeptide ABC transporter ATP-binding protein
MTINIAAKSAQDTLLTVDELQVSYAVENGTLHAVKNLSFAIETGETLGIVGESGSGKTQTALSLMGLLPETATVSGRAIFSGANLIAMSTPELNKLRGNSIAMIFQDPMTSLNPHLTIGRQMSRVLVCHQKLSRQAALKKAADMLDAVRIPEARSRLRQYPHEMSGGMRQRVMIATALLCKPQLLIADEPTTALDVTVQAQILTLLGELQQEMHTAILLITHDMGVVASSCDRVLVMRAGEQREAGDLEQIFYQPQDAYTRDLLAAVPRLDGPVRKHMQSVNNDNQTLLTVKDLQVQFSVDTPGLFRPDSVLKAVDKVSLNLRRGETLGVVGESGCGKSTLARGILHLLPLQQGQVVFLGKELAELDANALKKMRSDMQLIFQDPLASLNPRMTVGDIVAEPLLTFRRELNRAERLERVRGMLKRVGLEADHVFRYPHEFSGGQCQRIGIARALIAEPELIICDEPVSALDVSVQAQIVNLLMDLQQEMGLSLIFIAHDLAVVRQISQRVLVMYLGRVMEISASEMLYENPRHPYTQALISAVPIPDPKLERSRVHTLLSGDVPSPVDPPSGCVFRTRCPLAEKRCAEERPELRQVGNAEVACHLVADEISL